MREPPQMGEVKGPRRDASKTERLMNKKVMQPSGMELMDLGLQHPLKVILVHWSLPLDPRMLPLSSHTSTTWGMCSHSHIHILRTLILRSTGWLSKYSSFCWLFFLPSENIHVLRVRNAQTPWRLCDCSFPLLYFSQALLFCCLCSFCDFMWLYSFGRNDYISETG